MEAVMSRNSDKWLEAMKSEIDSMYSNQVWTLVDAPEGVTLIGYKWVYKKKIGVDGQVKTHKVRLVAKSFRQNRVLIMMKYFYLLPCSNLYRLCLQ